MRTEQLNGDAFSDQRLRAFAGGIGQGSQFFQPDCRIHSSSFFSVGWAVAQSR